MARNGRAGDPPAPDRTVEVSNAKSHSSERPPLTSVFADVVLPDRPERRQRPRGAPPRATMARQRGSRTPRIPSGVSFGDPSDPVTERALRKLVRAVIVGASEEQRGILLGRRRDRAARQRVLAERFNEWRQQPREQFTWLSRGENALARLASTRLRERPLAGRRAT